MGKSNFSRSQCLRALKKLGFTQEFSRSGGKHDKFVASGQFQIDSLNPKFIMIPRHGKLRCQFEILKELRSMGGNELEQKFIGLL